MPFKLNPKQEEAQALISSHRHTCLVGGSRSGKTFIAVRTILLRAFKAPSSRHAILRYRTNAARASIWLDTVPKVLELCFPQIKLTPYRQDGYFQAPNQSQVWVGGLDEKERVEKILGQEYATMFLNECSQIPYSSVIVARTRLAQKIEGLVPRMLYDLNPTGRGHWTNKLFGQHVDPMTLLPLAEPEQYGRMFMNPVDNTDNLTREYLADLDALPERQRRRFYLGEYVEEIDGALWTPEVLDTCRVDDEHVPHLIRVVVAVDPSGTSGEEDERSDAIGIITAGLGTDGIVYVLEDATCRLPPAGWGYRVAEQFHRHRADRVVAEVNYGGEMVRYVIEQQDKSIPVTIVTASRGKAVRAEPISALYEKGMVRHVGRFPELEDQLLSFSTAGFLGERSPDRADALVWAVTELSVGKGTPAFSTPIGKFTVSRPTYRGTGL